MCGIAGIVRGKGSTTQNLKSVVVQMANTLAHRGPDDHDVWFNEAIGVGLGHRRLSIIDLKPTGHQPMSSPSGRYIIVFNGEIYNFQTLRQELDQISPRNWKGHSDTEVLLAALEEWGLQKTLDCVNGMFAFALFDNLNQQLVLARDCMGEKPLYYGWLGNDFLFASELKAFKVVQGTYPPISLEGASQFFRYGYIPAPLSILQGVHKLLPGRFLCIDLPLYRMESFHPVSYWNPEKFVAEKLTSTNFHEEKTQLEEILSQVIAEQSVSDVPLGCFLSGGVDSSLVAALMQRQNTQKIRTYSIGFEQKDFNEAHHAKAVANHLGTDHTKFFVSDAEAREVIPQLPRIYDEPFADSSQIPTFLVSQLARQHVTVALSGDGADELFGGYNRYQLMKKIFFLQKIIPRSLAQSLEKLLSYSYFPFSQYDTMRRLKGLMIYLSKTAHEAYEHHMSIWRNGIGAPCLFAKNTQLKGLEDIMFADILNYLPDDILVKVDRAAMAASLETRAPFLDRRVVEFALKLPLSYKFQKGQGKYILRDILYQYVPRSLIDRPKMGFGVPLDAWLKGPLQSWAKDCCDAFLRSNHQDLINKDLVAKTWDDHYAGVHSQPYRLWSICMYQTWLENEYSQ